MHAADTILAHASAPGASARAVVRVSGPAAADVGRAVLEGCERGMDRRGTFAARLRLPTASGSALLPILVTRFLAPASYTGEDVLEIQIPGNPHLLERVIAALLACGSTGGAGVLRLAHPGEFTARAYFGRKLTLEQAEGVAAIIAARTDEQLKASRALLTGETGRIYRGLGEECATLLALVESGIDFTDQDDVVPIAPAVLAERVEALGAAVATLQGGGRAESVSALPRVGIVGRPNAGKSTLFNALLGRRRAVESPAAGTTRDVLEETLDLSRDALGTGAVLLMDLPGLEAVVEPSASASSSSSTTTPRGTGVWPVSTSSPLPSPTPDHLAQRAARAALLRADALLWCDPTGRFEAEAGLHESDLAAMGLTRDLLSTRPVVRVRTFADRLDAGAGDGNGQGDGPIRICALDGWNLATLRRALADAACAASAGHLAALLPRHRLALARAQAHLHEARRGIDAGASSLGSPELVADSLRAALDQLGELAGHISPDDVLGRVFATFCVGK